MERPSVAYTAKWTDTDVISCYKENMRKPCSDVSRKRPGIVDNQGLAKLSTSRGQYCIRTDACFGLYHEHRHPDRDKYLTVIVKENNRDFGKVCEMDVVYFAKPGTERTNAMGQCIKLSAYDINALNALYPSSSYLSTLRSSLKMKAERRFRKRSGRRNWRKKIGRTGGRRNQLLTHNTKLYKSMLQFANPKNTQQNTRLWFSRFEEFVKNTQPDIDLLTLYDKKLIILKNEITHQGGYYHKTNSNQHPIHIIPPDEIGVHDPEEIENGNWYTTSHMGQDKLTGMLKEICNITGIDYTNRRIVNHSLRKYTSQKLNDEGLDSQAIMNVFLRMCQKILIQQKI
ncbi:hypothetical protein GLOIN_2v1699990 [Rhizophagus irregularis DAOM 181602=DAOM 197198]|nr:hypothetical protein GLOIN_2v1699990 [Rhizophagus irregularis DAOM 181602=DAOM 197198]